MHAVKRFLCAAMVLLWASASWAQGPAQADVRPLFDRALDLALPRDTAPVALGDIRMTLRVVPPRGRESQVIFLLHGKATTAEAMQAVSVRQQLADWVASGQATELEQWAKTVQVSKADFAVPPEMRNLLDGHSSIDFEQCSRQHDTMPNAIHYELWVESEQNVKDIHAYSTRGVKCAGLLWMQRLRQMVRQQVPELEVPSTP